MVCGRSLSRTSPRTLWGSFKRIYKGSFKGIHKGSIRTLWGLGFWGAVFGFRAFWGFRVLGFWGLGFRDLGSVQGVITASGQAVRPLRLALWLLFGFLGRLKRLGA